MDFEARSLIFTFELDGAPSYRRRLDGVHAHLEDFSPALERIGGVFRKHMLDVFGTEGAATGTKWAPLNKDYAAWKSRHYGAAGVLSRERQLKYALGSAGASGNISQVSAREAVFGGSRRTPDGKWDLGLVHHHGRRDGRLKARPILVLSPAVKARFTRILREFVNQEPRGGWKG